MATPIPVSKTSRNGSIPTNLVLADLVNGNSFVNDGQTYLVLDNKQAAAGSPSVTVTVSVIGKADFDLNIADRVYTLVAGDVFCVGPFDKALFNPQDDSVSVHANEPVVLAALSILS